MTASIRTFTDTAADVGRGGQDVLSAGLVQAEEGLGVSPASVQWGTLSPNMVSTENLTVSNTLDRPARLYLNVLDWKPVNATNYLAISWDYDGTYLAPKSSREIALTLTVFANATNFATVDKTGAFNNTIKITAVWG